MAQYVSAIICDIRGIFIDKKRLTLTSLVRHLHPDFPNIALPSLSAQKMTRADRTPEL